MVAHVKGKAPNFKKIAVVDGIFEEISLSQYEGHYVVLAFVPNAFTYVCPTEIIAFSEAVDEFHKLDCQVLFVSTDSHFCLSAWTDVSREEGGLGEVKVPLISDSNHTMSRDYGVYFAEEGIALRGLFIIDPQGIIKHITVNDTPVGRNVEETLRIIEAFQSNDKDGRLLPCNWHPGDQAIMPDFDQFKKSFDELDLQDHCSENDDDNKSSSPE
ncbi:peroxiredoxin Tsa1p [Monosporozyma unispora]|nr:cTPxI [Kazachstania unispora]